MDRLEALKLAELILGSRPKFKGFLKTKEETAYWVFSQIYVRGYEIKKVE